MTKARVTGLIAALALAPLAIAQDAQNQTIRTGQQPTIQVVPQQNFESLAKVGPDGKVIRIDGVLDLLALRVNPKVDAATLERARPVIKEWLAEVDTLTIENLDFIEMIDPLDGSPGLIEKFDLKDTRGLTTLAQIMTHLLSAGQLSNYLETRGVLTREQSQLNQQISSDYLQKVLNEIMAEQGLSGDMSQNKTEEERTRQTNIVSRFLYGMTCRDAMESYKRLLVQTAPQMDKALAEIGVESATMEKVQPAVAQAKAAKTPDAKRTAVREVMKSLSFDQRRALLEKGRELAGDFDPLSTVAATEASGQPAAAR